MQNRSIYKFCFCLALLVPSVVFAAPLKRMVLPRIFEGGGVVLGSTIDQILSKEDPGFKVFARTNFSKLAVSNSDKTPMAKTADFNSDGLRDIVIFGYSSTRKVVLVYGLVSDRNTRTYKVHELTSYPKESNSFKQNPFYITLFKKKMKSGNTLDIVQYESAGDGSTSVTPFFYSMVIKDFKPFEGVED